jgi:hypothetical protein
MRIEEYKTGKVTFNGWDVDVTSYRMGAEWYAQAINSPGFTMCRTTGLTRDDALMKALRRAEEILERTRRQPV